MIPWPFSPGSGAAGFKQLAAVSSKGQSKLLLYCWHHRFLPVCLLKRIKFTFQGRRVGDLGISVSLLDTQASVESSRTAVSKPRHPLASQNKSHLALSPAHSQEESGMGAMGEATFSQRRHWGTLLFLIESSRRNSPKRPRNPRESHQSFLMLEKHLNLRMFFSEEGVATVSRELWCENRWHWQAGLPHKERTSYRILRRLFPVWGWLGPPVSLWDRS